MAVQSRLERRENSECNPEVMQILHDVMVDCNPYVAAYRNMSQIEEEQRLNNASPQQVKMVFKTGINQRRYNTPVHDEVAAVFVGDSEGAPPSNVDIVVYPHGENLRSISNQNPNLDPLLYPVFFPRGLMGWSPALEHVAERRTRVRQRVTQNQFYSFMMSERNLFSPIHHGGKLFQQYLVDAYVKTESARLNYLRLNQKQLRVESYRGLMDYIASDAIDRGLPAGKPVILP